MAFWIIWTHPWSVSMTFLIFVSKYFHHTLWPFIVSISRNVPDSPLAIEEVDCLMYVLVAELVDWKHLPRIWLGNQHRQGIWSIVQHSCLFWDCEVDSFNKTSVQGMAFFILKSQADDASAEVGRETCTIFFPLKMEECIDFSIWLNFQVLVVLHRWCCNSHWNFWNGMYHFITSLYHVSLDCGSAVFQFSSMKRRWVPVRRPCFL